MNEYSRKIYKSPLITYLILSIFVHYVIFFKWSISGEIWAELATNYYLSATSNSFLKNLIATDYGYISPIMRLLPWIIIKFNLSDYSFLILLNMASSLICIFGPTIIFFKKFNKLIVSDYSKLYIALLLSCGLNFELRIYNNISHIFFIFIFLILSNYLLNKKNTVIDKFISIILILGKPFNLVFIPMIFSLIYYKSKERKFFIVLLLMLFIQIFFIFTNFSFNSNSASLASHILSALLLEFFNFGKIILLFIPPIILKIFHNLSETQINFIIFFTGSVGLFSTLFIFYLFKTQYNKFIINIIIINFLYAFLYLNATHSSSLALDISNANFNKYDLITFLNIISITILFNKYDQLFLKKIFTIYLPALTFFIFTTASIYQYLFIIKGNFYYQGTSTWLERNNSNNFNKYALITPFGWGTHKIDSFDNVFNRKVRPTFKKKDNIFSIKFKYIKDGFIILFFKKSFLKQISTCHLKDNSCIQGEFFNLTNDNLAVFYQFNCNKKTNNQCIVNFKVNGDFILMKNDGSEMPLIYVVNRESFH